MAVDFTTRTVQIYEADISDLQRNLNRKESLEKKATATTIRAATQQSKATRGLAQQMDILTMAVGGMGSEVGKGAEISKRLADGFGVMGVAMFGIGLGLRELAPLVHNIFVGFGDLLGLGGKESNWEPFKKNLKDLRVEAEKLDDRLLSAQRALMDTFGQAQSKRLEAVGEAAVAANELSRARIDESKQRAEIRALEAELLHADWGAEQQIIKTQIALQKKLLEPLTLKRENAEKLAEAARLEAEHTEVLMKQADPLLKQTEARTKAVADLNDEMERSAKYRPDYSKIFAPEPELRLPAMGAGGGNAIGPGGPLGSITDPLGRIVPPDAPTTGPSLIEKLFGKPEEIDAVAASFNVLAEGVNAAFDALASGEGAAAAWDAIQKTIAESLAKLMFRYAKAEMAHAAAAFAIGNGWGVAQHLGAAALFTAAGAYAGSFAGSSASAGASTGGFSTSRPAGGGTTINETINLGDSYIGLSNRRRKAELERILKIRSPRAGSYEG